MKNPLPIHVYKKRARERRDDIRGDYFRDQTAIIHSMAFRRLKNKTQAFFAPENDHICTRIEHVLHVATIGATICKGLIREGWELDEELAVAIGYGHDLGHAPFGHSGEQAINEIAGSDFAYHHEIHSYRVARYLTNNGRGLNLTYGVNDGIICHNGEYFEQHLRPRAEYIDPDSMQTRKHHPASYEGCIIRFADKMAYLGRDLEDASAAGIISLDSVPDDIKKALGKTNGAIINALVIDIIKNTLKTHRLGFSDGTFELMKRLKKFNYENIYNNPGMLEYKSVCQNIIRRLFEYLDELYARLGHDYEAYAALGIPFGRAFGEYMRDMHSTYSGEENLPWRIIVDYIGGMTDKYAIESMKQVSIPRPIEQKNKPRQ